MLDDFTKLICSNRKSIIISPWSRDNLSPSLKPKKSNTSNFDGSALRFRSVRGFTSTCSPSFSLLLLFLKLLPLMEYDNSDNLFLDTLMCLYSTSDTQTWFEFLGAVLQELDEPKYLILHQLKHLAVEHKYLPVEEPLLVHQSDIHCH